jgi:glycosyltransferase involved in cell wall biosynthesis
MRDNLKILILIPCYNEEKRLPIDKFLSYLRNNPQLSFCFIDDGSSDNTLQLLNDIESKCNNASVLALAKNVGKANAIREGILKNSNDNWDYIGFMDGDLAIPLDEIQVFHDLALKKNQYKLVSAARVRLLGYSNVKNSTLRHIISRGLATLISTSLKLPIYDSQCGTKFYHSSIFHVFESPFISKWLCDVEILFRLKKSVANYESLIFEVPLRKCINPPGSKIALSYYFKAPFELLRIYLKYR